MEYTTKNRMDVSAYLRKHGVDSSTITSGIYNAYELARANEDNGCYLLIVKRNGTKIIIGREDMEHDVQFYVIAEGYSVGCRIRAGVVEIHEIEVKED